ncbi:glycosyltransferase [Dolichospermum circinale CS-1225]|uniref:glycosyltransferase n=1 Tax=Dolichospermum circinale TaxID=109265 RepID=UPI00232FA483|nr:glycosyltransferase [Dolichospermum circinale]MDB9521186.1 glycosyltransferase [Dolichospermum circinale CS-1225]
MNKPLKIGLLMQGGRSWIGGTEYIKNIIFALSSLPHEVRSTFELSLLFDGKYAEPEIQEQLKHLLDYQYNLDSELEPYTFINRLKWKIIRTIQPHPEPRLSPFLNKANIDFVYPFLTPNKANLSYRGFPWIFDFQHKYMPNLFSDSEIKYRDGYFAQISELSSRVVLSSKTSAADFQKFYPDSQCATEVLHFRTSLPDLWFKLDPIETQRKYFLPDRFFLISNQFWQHKNHLIVLEALKILQGNSIYPQVVCTGHVYDHRQPNYSDKILTTIHTYGLANQVYLLGLIPRSDQIQLMRRSLAVIQPSLFEGWSTVIEDARCLGKKMIISDFPVHLEQNPPGSVFFNRNSPEQLAELIGEWWRQLSSGPDVDQENLARIKNIEEVQAFGYRFLEIVRSA